MPQIYNPGTNRQDPDHSILDNNNKPTYLGCQFVYSIPSTTIVPTTETPIFLLNNPIVTTTAFPSNYRSIFCNFRKVTVLNATASALFRFYFNPTVTSAGTPVTPINLRPASLIASIAAASGGTITTSSNGAFITILASYAFFLQLTTVLFILDPGNSLLVTVTVSTGSTPVEMEVGWYEQ